MNNTDQGKIYERLNKTEPTRRQMLEYDWAIKELAEGLTGRSVWEIQHHVQQAERRLTEWKSNFLEVPKLNEKEADMASSLHTYMRKYMDGPLSCMMYRMVAEGRGASVWFAFVKGLVSFKMRYREGINAAHNQYDLDQTTDNALMYYMLEMWEEDWKYVLETFKEFEKNA